MKAKVSLLALLFVSMSSFASDWRMSYINPHAGSLLIDHDSIVDQGSEKSVWTLFAPRVTMGQAGEGYAYRKTRHQIDCAKRTSAIHEAIYYDEFQKPHSSQVEDKMMHSIVPDSDDDYLWQYV